ncbi:MAG: hypothetical protein H0W84_05515 [Bacteroidetes bacterium]|nr:hypothetical protein [Bacteroidota bacterium]
MGHNYFPTDVGYYVVYDVDSFFYDDFNNRIDTFKFQLKEKIQSVYTDNENRPTVRLERYKKNYSPTLPYNAKIWSLKNVWAENLTTSTAEKVEENIRYAKLKFPVKKNQKWNGKVQNTLTQWNYEYAFFDLPRTIGGIHFDSVLQVTQFDDKFSNLVAHKYYIEKYARNYGLIYKQVIDVESQPPNPTPSGFFDIPIMQRVTSGFQYTMTVNYYGME